MSNMQKPPRIPKPFAEDGLRNEIPVESTITGLASWSKGWDNINSEELEEGGIPPSRLDFNALFNIITQHLSYIQKGGFPTWSDEEGYYPPAIVQHSDGLLYQCKVANGKGVETVRKPDESPWYWRTITFTEELTELLKNIESLQSSLTTLQQQINNISGSIWEPVDATTSRKGIVEFATDAEAKAAALDNKALTPANLLNLVIAGGGGGGGGSGKLMARTFTSSGSWKSPVDGPVMIHLIHGGGGGGGTGAGGNSYPITDQASVGNSGNGGGYSTRDGGKAGNYGSIDHNVNNKNRSNAGAGGGAYGGDMWIMATATKDTSYTVTVGAGGKGGTPVITATPFDDFVPDTNPYMYDFGDINGKNGGKSSVSVLAPYTGTNNLSGIMYRSGEFGKGADGLWRSEPTVAPDIYGRYNVKTGFGTGEYGGAPGGGSGGGNGGNTGESGTNGTEPGAGGGGAGHIGIGSSGPSMRYTANGGDGHKGQVTIYYLDSGEGESGGGTFSNSRVFSSSGTWKSPVDGPVMIHLIHGGAGGGGGGARLAGANGGTNGFGKRNLSPLSLEQMGVSGDSNFNDNGEGGGGGAYGGDMWIMATATKDTSYTVTVGAGGKGGDGANISGTKFIKATAGGNSGRSSVSILAPFNNNSIIDGIININDRSGFGGNGGNAIVGDINGTNGMGGFGKNVGGIGGKSSNSGNSTTGGGGGGGGAGGGDGGNGVYGIGDNGTNGTQPGAGGGGGGGGLASQSGGNGGDGYKGQVIIYW